MADQFILHDLYLTNRKAVLCSEPKPLICLVCKKDLSGMPITARVVNGKTIFLCPAHLKVGPGLLIPES